MLYSTRIHSGYTFDREVSERNLPESDLKDEFQTWKVKIEMFKNNCEKEKKIYHWFGHWQIHFQGFCVVYLEDWNDFPSKRFLTFTFYNLRIRNKRGPTGNKLSKPNLSLRTWSSNSWRCSFVKSLKMRLGLRHQNHCHQCVVCHQNLSYLWPMTGLKALIFMLFGRSIWSWTVNYARDIELRMYRLGIILTRGNKCEKIRKIITGFEFAD